ncbi:MAG: MarR family transcriptional regulator [Myxococcales bacterium]|nr:MarR family transcriptional regulator [Myxococcales bacterium]MCB9568658.1 MarR family transcriptional regulator [Myxococcales bacterium]
MTDADEAVDARLGGLAVLRVWALWLRLEARLGRELAAFGLTIAEFRLIGELMQAPEGLRQGELARRLGVRPPTVSAAVARLERGGIVARVRDPDDPRAWRVSIAAGAPLVSGVDVLERLEGEALADLEPPERATLVDLLDRVTAGLSLEE